MALAVKLRVPLYDDTLRVALTSTSFWLPNDVKLSASEPITVSLNADVKHHSVHIGKQTAFVHFDSVAQLILPQRSPKTACGSVLIPSIPQSLSDLDADLKRRF